MLHVLHLLHSGGGGVVVGRQGRWCRPDLMLLRNSVGSLSRLAPQVQLHGLLLDLLMDLLGNLNGHLVGRRSAEFSMITYLISRELKAISKVFTWCAACCWCCCTTAWRACWGAAEKIVVWPPPPVPPPPRAPPLCETAAVVAAAATVCPATLAAAKLRMS